MERPTGCAVWHGLASGEIWYERCGTGGRPAAMPRGRTVMKVQASVKPRCEKCKLIRRHGVLRVICEIPKHKQRQG